ncbi:MULTISPECIES: KilA-N domain-containing protein [Eubacteriales]|uniref:KilA-N domain-containing protein n=1 Tax=Flintibacter hominis TaxID=2763048 RepID=A0A8J6J187_9FIRM|nr:KilA-N domain-containing protein [Muriventricola aceti]MBC5723601.1 KilA-N domain-containing protein [Flintibacter hominis]MCU6701947.1 KilA-N domain-containing protein [Muriventricola aceti]SCI80703.1 KilA-N domain [uncultured Flavonifractor sp.]
MSAKKVESVIHADGVDISVVTTVGGEDDYISLTDIAKHRNPEFPADVVKNWMRLRSTLEFLGLWEELNNPNFNMVDFDQFKNDAGSNAFVMSPQKWIKSTNAIGLISKSGRYGGGTFAHKDIAFEFASWLSPEFKLYIIKDYQRLKEDEGHRLALDWNVKRILVSANYKIHTDAIKENLIPPELSKQQQGYVYADEADLLNVVLFGKTAKQWRIENPGIKGNIRDYATIEQLLVLTNLENLNAYLVNQGVPQPERMKKLRATVVYQLKTLSEGKGARELNYMHNQLKLPVDE